MVRKHPVIAAVARVALIGMTAFTLLTAARVLGGPSRHPGHLTVRYVLVAEVPEDALPPGHPPVEGRLVLPPGHPPIGDVLPPGHPPLEAGSLPPGHPPADGTRPAPVLFPQDGTSAI
jgi:hypothetical protein